MTEEKITNNGAFVLSPIVERYTFAKSFQGDSARGVYRAVKGRVAKDFKNAPAFAQYFKFNDSTGQINGSNLFYGILVNEELSKEGLWLPTIAEAKQLDAQGKLTNGVYRDYGIAVYDSDNPNAQIAKTLIKEASKRGWKTPLLAPFKALKLTKDRSKQGVRINFADNVLGIMSGDEAQEYLNNQFNHQGNSGVCRLLRSYGGSWNTIWLYLAYSDADGRVGDWVCGEATTQNLEKRLLEEINRTAQTEIQKINDRLVRAREAGLNILRG